MSWVYDPSPAALAPLMTTFWEPAGWRRRPAWPGREAMHAAVAAGVMFAAPRADDHDGWVRAARTAAQPLSTEQVGSAFLASLTSHRLDLRSALGSYAVARFLPEHPFAGQTRCTVCGQYINRDGTHDPEDMNVLSFERFKWGGVRHERVEYGAFDLEQFARAPVLAPTQADIKLGQQVIDYLRQLAPRTTAAQAVPGLKMIAGNKHERAKLLDILGLCGVLNTPRHPSYASAFIPAAERHEPALRHVFGSYPTSWWKAEDGINTSVLQRYLPQLT
jgi:hypothetical protein